jgi:APA family basic amino acid/polyamine antiporter
VATVAIGWSSYCRDVLHAAGWNLPTKLLTTPFDGGIINLPAVLIVLFLTGLLILGVKAGARFNAVIVLIKLIAIALFIWVACLNVNLRNWQHFMPFGWVGVVNGASLIFFAYIGFDAVSTAAEEAKNPQRDLPRSIILSLLICTLVYVAVSGLLTLMTPYTTLNTASPVADIVLRFGYRMTASFIAVGALAGLTTVMLVMFYGLSRIMLAMSRDVLLPKIMSHLNKHTKTPARIIFFAGCLITILAGLLPIRTAAEMVNIGTLAAFLCVNLGTIILRHTQPNIPRPFRVPFGYFLPTLGVFFCLYLMLHLPWVTWVRFFGWMLLGLVFYWYQAKRHLIQ